MIPAPALTAKAGGQWQWERPATTVQGDLRVWPPGHHANANQPGKSRNEGAIRVTLQELAIRVTLQELAIRVTLQELAILQDFPPDWPFVGNRSSVARQIGNACPAKLSEACVRAVM
jgi:site-specific DNA-cytosine methylase